MTELTPVQQIVECERPYIEDMVDAALRSADPRQMLVASILELGEACWQDGHNIGTSQERGDLLSLVTDDVERGASVSNGAAILQLLDGMETGARAMQQDAQAKEPDPTDSLTAYRFGYEEGKAEGFQAGYEQALRKLARNGGQ